MKKNEQTISIPNRLNIKTKTKKKNGNFLSLLPFNFIRKKPVISVLRLDGIIGKVGAMKSGLTLESLNKKIEKAFAPNNLEAVCLLINSPGGSPVQSELIADRIINLAQEKKVPIYSFVEDVAASGGYWLACIGDEIYASASSIIGSIGVISSSFGFQDAIEKLGIERRVFTEGKSKSVMDPFRPVKDSDISIIQKIQKTIHEHFIDIVKTRRSGKLTQEDELLFNGEFWPGAIAVDYGLIDGLDNFHAFISKKYGDDVKIEYIEHKQSWLKKKLGINTLSEELASNLVSNTAKYTEELLQNSRFSLK